MKSIQFKNNNNSKASVQKKIKAVKFEKKNPCGTIIEVKNAEMLKCDDTEWVPSRDWHKYLSGEQSEQCKKAFTWDGCPSKDEHKTETYEDLVLKKPSDELITIKFPTVNFCSEDKKANPQLQKNTTISDLCERDKIRIAQMVQELARYKQEKQEDEETILMLKNKVAELKSSMRKLLSNKNSDSKTISKIQSHHESEQLALKNQLSELNQLVCHMQVEKATSEVQLKIIASQAEKMTRVIHDMHRENTELQIKLTVTKDRLSVAQNAVEKITKDLQGLQNHIKPVMEDKACQSVEDLVADVVKVENKERPSNIIPDDQRILCELFFNKSIQNDFAPKETVIILPTDSFSLLEKN